MRLKRIMAGLTLCLFLFSLTACGSAPEAEIKEGEATEQDTVRYEKLVTVEGLYTEDELQADETLVALTQTGLFKTESLEYSLCNIVWEPMTITDRYIDLVSSTDYGFVTSKPTNAAAEKEVSYTDEKSGETLTARLPLVSLAFKGKYNSKERLDVESVVLDNAVTDKGETSFGWAWREDLKIPLKATLTGEYLEFGKLYIPYDAKAPVFITFETAVLNSLGLDLEKYKITGSYWSGDVKTEDGVEVRYGCFTGERYCADFVAAYEGRLTLPDVQGCKATLVYEAFSEKDNAPTVLGVGGAFVLAIPLLTWFFIVRRKKDKKEEKENDKA
ncbi:MAG: hypothetical protein VB092_08120 [Oscillospiraceae bacterium]|nr:hypothetical protein [Oscillospiraceae bacterium]